MRARDLVEELPTVTMDDGADHVARLIAEQRLPGVAVLDKGKPVAVLTASQVVRFVVPEYVQEDPSLARVLDERTADSCADELAKHTVRDLLPSHGSRVPLAMVAGDATVVECAAVMARMRSPLLVVADGKGRDGVVVHGLLTASHLLEVLLAKRIVKN